MKRISKIFVHCRYKDHKKCPGVYSKGTKRVRFCYCDCHDKKVGK